jgi:formylglycine-generating enzyme required for sulfatase activity
MRSRSTFCFSSEYPNLTRPVKTQKKIGKPTKSSIKRGTNLKKTSNATQLTLSKPTDLSLVIPSADMVLLKGQKNWCKPFRLAKNHVTVGEWNSTILWAQKQGYRGIEKIDGSKDYCGVNYPARGRNLNTIALWCNARSEQEGLQPCYLLDGTVFRSSEKSSPYPFLDWLMAANGYRLPTKKEWRFAYGSHREKFASTMKSKGQEPNESIAYSFSEVGITSSESNGINDLIGNVREWVWDYWLYPQEPRYYSYVMGTSYDQKPTVEDVTAGYKIDSWSGDRDMGFRLARNK